MIHGGEATLLWGHQPAVVIKNWRIVRSVRTRQEWRLLATVVRVDAFQARQTPLVFVAPRAGGFWRWPITKLALGTTDLWATLGPPEQ